MSIVKPDLILFVGDISEGNIKIIKKVKCLETPTFVILGNHDRGKDKSGQTLLKQIRLLDEKYCAWDLKIFDNKINILSGRPCSSGGGYYLSKEVQAVYGPISEDDSAKKIIQSSNNATNDFPLILMAHSGPTGLGSEANSICGKDWKKPASDWGDRDLAIAIRHIQKNRFLDIVIFGHMHNELKRNLGKREMFKIDMKGTIYLNAAVVPRYKLDNEANLLVNFSWLEFNRNQITKISQKWFSESGEVKEEKTFLEKNTF